MPKINAGLRENPEDQDIIEEIDKPEARAEDEPEDEEQ
jgi:hypothetical protein